MIGHLSTTITAAREFIYSRTALRYACYMLIAAALLLYWLYSGSAEIAFVYNNF